MTDRSTGEPSAVPRTAEEAAGLAARYGLEPVDARPGLWTYLRELWRHRAFVLELATAKAYSRNQNNYLGQLWAALNPLLLAGAYFLIFGLLLRTSDGVVNYIGFLTIGIFIFSFIAASMTGGAKAIVGHQSLVRAIRFPRAALPISIAISEIIALLPALVVLMILLPLPFSGEAITTEWLLLPVALVPMFVFCTGLGMIVARLVAQNRDAANIVPLVVRLSRYVSGVFFSIEAYAGHGPISAILQYQPIAVYLNLIRSCLLEEYPQDPLLWGLAVGWAVLLLSVGTVWFWRAERRYGRE